MESGRDDLSSHLLIFPSVLDQGKEIREEGGSSLGAPENVPKVRLLLLFFLFRSKIGLRHPVICRRFIVDTPEGRRC